VIGVDTNVLIRYLAQDDPAQAAVANRFIAGLSREQPGFVSSVVLAEVTWVLSRAYKAHRSDIATIVQGLLRAAELRVDNVEAAYRALSRYQASKTIAFSDALIMEIAALAGASETVTFDLKAARELGMRLLT